MEKKGLKECRREWIEMTKGMDDEQKVLFMNSFVGKAYLYAPGGLWYIVEISGVFVETDSKLKEKKMFVVKSVKRGKSKKVHPWYILKGVEIEKKVIPVYDDQKITEKCYQLIWDNWKEYLEKKRSLHDKLSNAVKAAKIAITQKLCPYYEETHAWEIWNAALDDLSRKMHPTYIPVNSEGDVLWDAEGV